MCIRDSTYVKWDMNRHMSDLYSAVTAGGELPYRYMLGLYEVLERIFTPRPHILLETCSSGGNRFDLGMLCYSPQIWSAVYKRQELGYAEPKVGLAMHMRAFVPYNAKNLWHRIACRISEYNFQTKLNKTYMLGPEGPYADFLGLNYYARTATSGLGDGTLPNVPVNDLGWEIYPAGIVE